MLRDVFPAGDFETPSRTQVFAAQSRGTQSARRATTFAFGTSGLVGAILEERAAKAEAENEKLWLELEQFLRVKGKGDDTAASASAAPPPAATTNEDGAAPPSPPSPPPKAEPPIAAAPVIDTITEKERQRLEEEAAEAEMLSFLNNETSSRKQMRDREAVAAHRVMQKQG